MLTLTNNPNGAIVVYDGDCPFCRNYVSLMRLREAVGKVELVNARDGGCVVETLIEKNYDLNEGMAVIFGETIYYGDDAVVFISSIAGSSIMARLLAGLLRNKERAKVIYPIMKLGRRVTLRALGISLIPHHSRGSR